MAVNPYVNIQSSTDFLRFEFESIGVNRLKKLVRLDLVEPDENIYNLALCTLLPDGDEDCKTATRNGDMDAVLLTTAYIARIFMTKFPDRKIYFEGSDAVRSRKYQIGIKRYISEILDDYDVEGVAIDKSGNMITRELFQSGKKYDGFIFSLKNNIKV